MPAAPRGRAHPVPSITRYRKERTAGAAIRRRKRSPVQIMDKAAIKQKVCEAIAAHRADIEAISEAILAEPELGFKEVKTSRKVQEALERLGIEFTAGHGITGVKARMKGRNSKRTVAMLAELDAIVCRNHRNADPVTGAAHCCGHNIQIANMIAVACGLRDVMSELDGDVVLFAVPAEERLEQRLHRQAHRIPRPSRSRRLCT